MDKSAFFKLTYGLYIASVEYEGKMNGCIINTAVQTTSEPATMSATMLKTNLTTQLIDKKKSMTISVISSEAPIDIINHFGMNSGRDTDKFAAIHYNTDDNGNPYMTEGILCAFLCNIRETIDLGTHLMFLLDVTNALTFNDPSAPLTYTDYRQKKKQKQNAQAPSNMVCSVCHYVYDGVVPFDELPDDWKCPVCQMPKSVFVKE